MKNRIISILVAMTTITLIIMCFQISVYAKKYPQAEEAVEVLSKLNIIDVKYDPESETVVTREEFAVAIANAIKAVEADGRRFVDVDRRNKNVDKLNALYDMGIIRGYERYFNPTMEITVEQAAVIMLNATGRAYYIGQSSGNRIDPISLASDLDILQPGVDRNDTIDIGEMAQMIYQMMQVNTMEITDFSGYNLKIKDTGKTLFEIYHDVQIIEGYVDGIYGTSLSNQLYLSPDEISVNEEVYTLDYDIEQFEILGKNMRVVYAEDSNDTKTIIYMTPYKEFEEIVISDSDYISFDFDAYSIRYYVNDTKEKRADISRNARFVYNGEVIGSDIKDLMDSIDGSYDNIKITLRDTDGVGGFDLVVIEKYVNYYITGIDLTNTAIHGTNVGNSMTIDLSDEIVEYLTIINSSNEILDFDQLKTDGIASVFQSRDLKHAKVVYSAKRVSGMISDRDYEEYTFKIDDRIYTADAACWAKEVAIAKVDNSYTLYLDAFGKAAKLKMDKSSSKLWGYLIKNSTIESVDGEEVVVLRILVQDGTINDYAINEKVKIDGISYKNEESRTILQNIGETQAVNNNIKPKQQILRFKVNTDNKITWLDTVNHNVEEDDNDALKATIEPNTSVLFYSPNLNRFGYKTLVNSDTIFFTVPEVDTNGEMVNVSSKSIGRKPTDADYSVGGNTFYNSSWRGITGYVTNEDSAFQDVIVYKKKAGSTLTTAESSIAVVQSFSTVLNSDDEVTTGITVMTGGGEAVYIASDSSVADNINPGDLVEFSVDGKNVTSEIKKYYDYNADKLIGWGASNSYINTSTYRSDFTLTTGYVKDIVNGIVKISYDKSCTKVDEAVDISNAKVIVHDKSRNKNSGAYVGTAGDVTSYQQVGSNCSKIFIHSSNGVTLSTVVIYK